MRFDSPAYLVFLTVVVLVYWRLSHRGQNILLLGASYLFYAWWDWHFLALLVFSNVLNHHLALLLSVPLPRFRQRLYLTSAVMANLLILGIFKYYHFFVDSLIALLRVVGITHLPTSALHIVLPLAISFYTFQSLAYVIDVSRHRLPPAKNIINSALLVSLFPHLVAGPIQQPSYLLSQIEQPRTLDWERFFHGLMLIATGLFRKCVIANNCALIADAAFGGNLGSSNTALVLLGVYAYAWQIYADFSGYSDIARGSAQLLGFHFIVNFRQPYLALSVQDFWTRWHISLSTWLRDYLFLPISYWLSRKVEHIPVRLLRTDYAIYGIATLITMLLAGLWHGASWTFVAWGGLLGFALAVERVGWARVPRKYNPLRAKSWPLLSCRSIVMRLTVFHFICLAWILFRSDSLAAAGVFLSGLLVPGWSPAFGPAFIFLGLLGGALFLIDIVNEVRKEEYLLQRSSVAVRVCIGVGLLLIVALFSGNEAATFVYFQF